MFGFLQDSEGNKSSKRLWGSYLMGLISIMAIILFGCSIIKPIAAFRDCMELLAFLGGYATSLLISGVFEKRVQTHDK